MSKRSTLPGFYIATCTEYSGVPPLYKVGHTGDLRERLHDSAYVTCFPPNSWRFIATLEVSTKTAAAAIEIGVLAYFQAQRLVPSELVKAPFDDILAVALRIAAALKYTAVVRRDPVYPRAPSVAKVSAVAVEKLSDHVKATMVQHDILPLQAAAPAAPANAPIAEPEEAPEEAPANAPANAPVSPKEEPANAPVSPKEEPEDTPADFGELAVFDELGGALKLREYQQQATTAILEELRKSDRAIAQMACRCGKTPVAYSVATSGGHNIVLFLVPGLALLRQTAQKIHQYSEGRAPLLLIGSDTQAVTLSTECSAAMTTVEADILRTLDGWRASDRAHGATQVGPRWVISTYQSSPLCVELIDRFSLIVYDEAHRICGGRAPRPFNSVLLACERAGAPASKQLCKQLFMSATPAYDPITPDSISMRDRDLFGGVASRYYLRRGIDAGYVNNFRLQLVAAPVGAASEDEAMAGAIAEAMRHVEKLLVFCRDIAHADRLATATSRIAANFECSSVHSRLPAGAAQAALQRFATPGVRAALFNCRMLQEGVEVPQLNAVFFAAPRHSPRDIIQSICRPLNPVPGKPCSVVFLPVTYDAAAGVDAPANLRRYSTILPIVDALLEEDSRLFDMLIGGAPDDDMLQLLVVRAGGAASAAPAALVADAAQILAACRRVIRHGVAGAAATGRRSERLLRTDAIPWGRAFAELRRVVLECRRYPKTTDEWIFAGAPGSEVRVNLHAVYAAIAARYSAGTLEPYQRTDLESLPSWLPWGAEGPYAWGPCVSFLEGWLETHGIDALALEINKGGYVGLEATPMERLSGALTCVNQQVFGKKTRDAAGEMVVRAADRVPAAHAADLDRICARFGMRWRKEFRADGTVDPARLTFIQEAYGRFKRMFAEGGSSHPYIQEHFPGYPLKHARQCALDLRTEEALAALPPRRARAARTTVARPPRAPKK